MKNHGHYISFYQNGQKFEEGEYADSKARRVAHVVRKWQGSQDRKLSDGKLDGQWSIVYDKGVREHEVSYKAGQRNGIWKYYFPDGKQLSKQEEYRDDKLTALRTSGIPMASRAANSIIERPAPVGIQQQWYESGQTGETRWNSQMASRPKKTYWDKDGNQRKP